MAGYEVFEVVSMKLNANHTSKKIILRFNYRHILDKIVKRYAIDYPNLEIVGMISPPFVDKFRKKCINVERD